MSNRTPAMEANLREWTSRLRALAQVIDTLPPREMVAACQQVERLAASIATVADPPPPFRGCWAQGPKFERGPNEGRRRLCHLDRGHEHDHSDEQVSWPQAAAQPASTGAAT